MANLPLAAFLSSLGDSLLGYTKGIEEKREKKESFAEKLRLLMEQDKIRQQSAAARVPAEEHNLQRRALISKGINPDTGDTDPAIVRHINLLQSIKDTSYGKRHKGKSAGGDDDEPSDDDLEGF